MTRRKRRINCRRKYFNNIPVLRTYIRARYIMLRRVYYNIMYLYFVRAVRALLIYFKYGTILYRSWY